MGRPMIWFDTDAATAAARSWGTWGDRLGVDRHIVERRLVELDLHDRVDVVRSLHTAADDLWILATFVRAVRGAALGADDYPTDQAVTALWADAERIVDIGAPRRDAAAEVVAQERYVKNLAPSEVRDLFESEHNGGVADVLAALNGVEAIAYWNALDETEQLELARSRPDLIALRVIAVGGGRVSDECIAEADAANAYVRFSERFAIEFAVSVTARVVAIELGGGFTAVTTKLSDGSVELTLVEWADISVGGDVDIAGAASATAGVGLFGELHQRFRFSDEDAAADAIDVLRDAVREDASFGELLRDGGSVLWNASVAPLNATAAIANWAIPLADPVPTMPVLDLTPETLRALRDLWVTNGLTVQRGVGVHAGLGAAFDVSLGAFEAALDATAEQRLLFYDTDVAAADTTGTVGRSGVVFSGVASIDGGLPGSGQSPGAHASARTGFVVDLHHVDDTGTFITVAFHTTVGAGQAADLVDLSTVELDTVEARTAAMTVSFTLPVDDATLDAVGDLGRRLARGHLPTATLRELAGRAEVDVTITTGSVETTAFETDAVVVEGGVTLTTATETTHVALHQYPNGEMFSRADVDRILDEVSS